jgi:arylsulfatase A-like enzyme
MAEVLGKASYATAFYGKWHLGDMKPSYPTEHEAGEQIPNCS